MNREGQTRVCFYLDKDVKRRFHTACIEAGTTMSEELRELVHDLLAGNLVAFRTTDAARQQRAGERRSDGKSVGTSTHGR